MSFSKKNSARVWGRSQRVALSSSYRLQASLLIADSLREWLSSQVSPVQILLYRSVREEVDTSALFDLPAADAIYAPRVVGDDAMEWVQVGLDTVWLRGCFGVLEPQSGCGWQPSASMATVVVCPLTAFDRLGGRVGMGKGYFDRWLAVYRPHLSAVVGLAFSCQESEVVPMDNHDQPLQWVITEKERIACHSKY